MEGNEVDSGRDDVTEADGNEETFEDIEGNYAQGELSDDDQRQPTDNDFECVGNEDFTAADKSSRSQPYTSAKKTPPLKESIMDDKNVPIAILIAKYPQVCARTKTLEGQVFEIEKKT